MQVQKRHRESKPPLGFVHIDMSTALKNAAPSFISIHPNPNPIQQMALAKQCRVSQQKSWNWLIFSHNAIWCHLAKCFVGQSDMHKQTLLIDYFLISMVYDQAITFAIIFQICPIIINLNVLASDTLSNLIAYISKMAIHDLLHCNLMKYIIL